MYIEKQWGSARCLLLVMSMGHWAIEDFLFYLYLPSSFFRLFPFLANADNYFAISMSLGIEQVHLPYNLPILMAHRCPCAIKGHGNEAVFLGFLQKAVRHRLFTVHFEPFRFGLRIHGDIRNRKTTPRLAESGSRQECLQTQFFSNL